MIDRQGIVRYGLASFVMMAFLTMPYAAQSQNLTELFELKTGPYVVGAKGYRYTDYSRVYVSPDGTTRKPREVNGILWLPMDKGQQAGVSESTYAAIYEKTHAGFSVESFSRGFVRRGAEKSIVDDIIETSRITEIDENMLRTDHPVLIYYPGFNSQPFDNAVLCEFLASHGFLVVALRHQGNSEYGSYPSAVDLEAAVDDVTFMAGKLLQMGENPNRFIGIMGHSWGGLVSYLAAAKNPLFSAVISLDGSQTAAEIMDMAYAFVSDESLDNISAPVLAFVSAGYHHEYKVMRRKKYSTTILGKSWFMGHHQFTSNGILFIDFASREGVRGVSDFKMDKVAQAYNAISQASLRFLNYAMESDDDTFAALSDRLMADDSFSFAIERGEHPLPSQQAFEHMLQTGDFDKTVAIFHRAMLLDSGITLFSEDLAISIADYYLESGETDKARMVYGMVVAAYPNSADALYAQGRYFEKTGLHEVAGRYYNWALEKDPNHIKSQMAIEAISK